ncbi:MAG: hypothetical protein ACKPKO_31655, partial [Candidatus Fonsibacter sp.]
MLNITSLPDQADKAADPRDINMSDWAGSSGQSGSGPQTSSSNILATSSTSLSTTNARTLPGTSFRTPAGQYEGGIKVGG